MTVPDAIQLDDESLIAWPCLSETRLGDWVLRFGGNVYGRSNSIQPFGDPGCELAEAVAHCEAAYAQAGIRPMFRLPEGRDLSALDRILSARDYEISDPSHVLVASIGEAACDDALILQSTPNGAWLSAYQQASGRGSGREAAVATILSRTPECRRFASIQMDGEIAGVGLGVVTGSTVWLFSIATMPRFRGQGYGAKVTQSLMAWGATQGASRSALQVAEANTIARRLYARLGFEYAYAYEYRRAR